MIELALHYAARGWPIFPLYPGTKIPLAGSHGCKDATLDPARIETWWTAYPDANVAIATGTPSGLLVIDIDPRKTPEWLANVQSLALPRTFTIRTCSGGWHLYFMLPADSPITIGADLLPGVDWRGTGGYVVAPGSVVNGSTYSIERNDPIVSAPVALLHRVENASRSRRQTASTTTRTGPDGSQHMVIPASRRNDTLARIGCALRRWGVEYDALLVALQVTNAAHCEPPLDDHEVASIAASVSRYASAQAQRTAP